MNYRPYRVDEWLAGLTLRPKLTRVYAEPASRRWGRGKPTKEIWEKYSGFSLLAELADLAEAKTGYQRITPLTYRPLHPDAIPLWDEIVRVTHDAATSEERDLIDPDKMDRGIGDLLGWILSRISPREQSESILQFLWPWEESIQRIIHEVADQRGTDLQCATCRARWIQEDHPKPIGGVPAGICRRPAIIEVADLPGYRHTRCLACGEFVWWPKREAG